MREIDSRLREAIVEAVLRGTGPWEVDEHHSLDGTFEERFLRGDDQLLLWVAALELTRRKHWTGIYLLEGLCRAAIGEVESWDELLGPAKSPRDGRAPGKNWDNIRRQSYMFECYDCVEAHRARGESVGYDLFKAVGQELPIKMGAKAVENFYYRVKRWRRSP